MVKGPKGSLRIPVPPGIRVEKQDGHLLVRRESDNQAALHGLARSLIANAVRGVTQGFEKHLDIVGIGYRAEIKGRTVTFTLGYSHPIEFPIPAGVAIALDKQTHIVVSGADKQQVGRWRRKSAPCAPPILTRTRGSGTPASA